ncbi:MAG: DUF4397 domain-containing protein [Acidimicrobiales bacterium]
MNERSEVDHGSKSHWFGLDRLRLSEGDRAVDVTIGSQSHWDRSHLRRLRQSGDLPGMVPVIDSDFSADGKPFAVTAVLHTPTLQDLIDRGELEWTEGAAITEAAARAAHQAHLRGLFHGGLTPSDIHVFGNEVAIAGMGLSLGGTAPEDRAEWTAGEVRDGAEPTERSDVYSLGRVLQASLGDDLEQAPRSIRRLIMWSSSETPEARPPSAMEFASILAEGLGDRRTTYGPGFVATVDVADLAAGASTAVMRHTPSVTAAETARSNAGVTAAGTAAAASAFLAQADADSSADQAEEAALDLTDEEPVIDLTEEPTAEDPTGNPAGGPLETAGSDDGPLLTAITADYPAEEEDADIVDEFPPGAAPADTGELPRVSAPTTARSAAAATAAASPEVVDVDQTDDDRGRRNWAGLLLGAILLVGLGAIVWGLANSGGDETTANPPPATTAGTTGDNDSATTAGTTDDDNTAAATTPTTGDNAAAATGENAATASTTGDDGDNATTASTTGDGDNATTASTADDDDNATTADGGDDDNATTASTTGESSSIQGPTTVQPSTGVTSPSGPVAADQRGIQLVHGVPGEVLDVYIDGSAVATGFEAGQIAGPIALPAGEHSVAFFAARALAPGAMAERSDQPLLTEQLTVGSTPQSLVAYPDAGDQVQVAQFTEPTEALAPGTGRIAVRNLTGAATANVMINGESVATVSNGAESTAVVPAGPAQLELLDGNGRSLASATVTVGDGELASVSAIPTSAGGAEFLTQRYTGLGSAPAGVPTGDSGLLDESGGPMGLGVVYAVMGLLVISGAAVAIRRRYRIS